MCPSVAGVNLGRARARVGFFRRLVSITARVLFAATIRRSSPHSTETEDAHVGRTRPRGDRDRRGSHRALLIRSAAGGVFPQWNWLLVGVRGAAHIARTHGSLALSATGERWYVIHATPDIRWQIERASVLHPGPRAPRRVTPNEAPSVAIMVSPPRGGAVW
jgi:hypothetical protein